MSSWEAALDALEERIRRQEAVAELTTDVLPDDDLPEVDGPLPEPLRARAVVLLGRTRRLEELVEQRLAAASPRRPSYAGDTTAAGATDHGSL